MKVLLIYSGGLDSTVLLYHLLARGHEVACLGFSYGQKHTKELQFARAICQELGLFYDVVSLVNVFGVSSCLIGDGAIPEGHYQDDMMKLTVVPNRNMTMLAIAGAKAITKGCRAIAYGAHAGDHAIYPDCRPSFVTVMRDALRICHSSPLQLMVPFLYKDKTDIVREGDLLKVPFEKTWTCYKGGDSHCGVCGSCVERREAFIRAKVHDPTFYEATWNFSSALPGPTG